MNTRYISPTGSGLRDGSSPQNAGTLADLNTFVSAVGAGGQVLLLADRGAYHQGSQISLSSGGSAHASVTIRGVDSHGHAMAAEIVGSRAAHWTPGHAEGSELFRLTSGADNLSFRDLAVKDVGNGVFRAGADIHNVSISNVSAANVTRFFEDSASGNNHSATVSGLKIDQVTVAGYSKGAINLAYDSHGIAIDKVVGDSQGQKGGLFVTGVELSGTVHDVTISSTTMKNDHGTGNPSQYWNGDGFATEAGVHDVTFRNTVSAGNTDAGYDLKSSHTVLENTVAKGNNENYRFWSDSISMTNGTSLDPKYSGGIGSTAHIWMGDHAVAHVDHLTFSDSGKPQTLFNLTQTGSALYLADTEIPQSYNDLVRLYDGSKLVAQASGGIGDFVETGTAHSHTITGGALSDLLQGGSALDTILGGAGNDEIHGATGNDTLKGGDGNDSIFGDAGNDHLYGGAGTDMLSGGLHSDFLYGQAGNDTLDGGAGNDHMAGGAGNDLYIVDSAKDVIVENRGEGTDTVHSSVSYALGSNVENLTLLGTDALHGSGNALANTLTGNNAGNVLEGGGGNDRIFGEGGDDTLTGGAGKDTLDGGAGKDTLVYDSQDKFDGGAGNDRLEFLDKTHLDFDSGFVGRVHGIETLDIRNGAADSLGAGHSLTATDVLDMTDGKDQLWITADKGDSVTLSEGFKAAGTANNYTSGDGIPNGGYATYHASASGHSVILHVSADALVHHH
jgi:Ca2+-binding RTX toxin-like protein